MIVNASHSLTHQSPHLKLKSQKSLFLVISLIFSGPKNWHRITGSPIFSNLKEFVAYPRHYISKISWNDKYALRERQNNINPTKEYIYIYIFFFFLERKRKKEELSTVHLPSSFQIFMKKEWDKLRIKYFYFNFCLLNFTVFIFLFLLWLSGCSALSHNGRQL